MCNNECIYINKYLNNMYSRINNLHLFFSLVLFITCIFISQKSYSREYAYVKSFSNGEEFVANDAVQRIDVQVIWGTGIASGMGRAIYCGNYDNSWMYSASLSFNYIGNNGSWFTFSDGMMAPSFLYVYRDYSIVRVYFQWMFNNRTDEYRISN